MPSLGSDMEAGTLVEWLKNPGDALHRGDIVAVVETQKGAIEVEVFSNGVMGAQLVTPGTTVPVGAPLAIIEDGKEAAGKPSPVVRPSAAPEMALPAAKPAMKAGLRASPAARKAAELRGIDLASVEGTGPEGAVTLRDLEGAPAKAEAGPSRRGLDLDKMREAIAAAMERSKREIPHYYLAGEIDMGRALAWLEETNAALPPEKRILPAVLLIKASALAAQKYPAFNGAYTACGFVPSKAIHVGVAIAIRGGGLVAPAIHDTAEMNAKELMAHLRDLVARARVGRLRSSEFSDPTITVSIAGDRGAEALFGVIYPPQVAILGFGRTVRKPVALGDAVGIRPMVASTLSADHRVTDGHLGGLFLAEIGALLQEPERL